MSEKSKKTVNYKVHTHLFNGPLPGLPGWASNTKVKPIWIVLKQKTVSGSGISWAICKSASRSRRTRQYTFLIWLLTIHYTWPIQLLYIVKKGSPYLITKRRVPELILVLGSRLAGDVSHKPGDRLPLLSTRPAVTLAALIRAATSFTAWWSEAWWMWTACLRLFSDIVTAAIWTQALMCLSPAR